MEPGVAEPLWVGRLARTPFAGALAKGASLVIAAGAPPRIVFATPAALAALGAADAQELGNFLLAAEDSGARQLRRLALETAADAAPRVERLRFVAAGEPVEVAWLCARLIRNGETFFVAADVAAAATPARFVWRLDSDDRFVDPAAAGAERLQGQAPRAGETLAALEARVGLGRAWSERVAARETFSKLRVVWPEPDGAHGAAVLLSGAPEYAAGRQYLGYRGFGLLTGERQALPRPPARPAAGPAPVAATGDAAALINLLQRHHLPAGLGAQGAASAPALAVIAALAALLQTKAAPKPAPARAAPAEAPPQGAEIVVLRPGAVVADAAREGRARDSVALTMQERDAFKEIARALGVNVRANRNEPAPPPRPAPPPAPAVDDLAEILDILPVAVLVRRGDEALYANATLFELAGYADLADFRARDGLTSMFRGRDPQALAPNGAVVGAPLIAANGEILTVDAQAQPCVWRGAPAELVTLRRAREAEHQQTLRAMERETALHAARARDLSAALEAARDGMARLDRSGRVLGLNKGAEALFAVDQREVAGESVLALLAPESHAALSGALERLARGETTVESLEATARGRDGRLFPVRADLGRLANPPEPDFFLLLSDRSRPESGANPAHEAAEKQSAEKTELLSRVSHELRTPLNAILGFAEVMLEERFGPIGNDRYRAYLRDIQTSGRHVLSLANDLLDLSRIELGKLDLEFAPVEINAVVRDCVSLMQPQAARERVIMRLSLFEGLPSVMADPRSLRQILLNLMTNAVKYNEPGGQVIVSSALDDAGAVVLKVRDTGVGMSESELAVAMEPFRRVPGGKEVEGAGLGLPLAKALAEANHADFSIKSRKNQGTLVEIAFPAQSAAS